MGGVIFSTIVTLFIVPVIFSFFDLFRRRSAPATEPAHDDMALNRPSESAGNQAQ